MIPTSQLPCPPLYGTPRSPERATLGPRVAEIAEMMGRPGMPHQRHMWDVALEIDPDTGLLAYPEVVIIGPRQVTGKTEFVLPYMTHRCIGFEPHGPQRVLYTAQTADDARTKWRDLHKVRLERVRKLRGMFTSRLTQNREAFVWRNGSMWMPGSTTGKTSGTGDTLDLGVIDEGWAATKRTELGMRPAMMTRDSAQIVILSMIPGLSRALPGTWSYLKHKRQVGRARVDAGMRSGVAFFDFTAADGLDPGDPATWWSCMPGLGRTVKEQKVRDDYDAMDLVDFCAEYLGWEPAETTSRWTLIRESTWQHGYDPGSQIVGPSALCLEINDERTAGVICAAGRRGDGHWHVEVIEPGQLIPVGVQGTDWMLRRALDIVEAQEVCTVVIDPRRPAASLIVPLRNAGVDVLTPNQQDIAGACGRFIDATGDNVPDPDDADDPDDDGVRVFHLGQSELDMALAGAKRLDTGSGGAFTIVKRGSAANLIPLYGVVLAMLGHEVKAPVDYDVLDSVDSGRPCRCGRSLYVDDGVWRHAIDDTPEC